MKWKGRSFTPSAGRWNSSQALEQAAFLCVWMTLAGITSGCANFRSSVPNASYVGPYVGYENNLTVRQLQSDLRAAYRFKAVKYPGGFVTIFGGSRIPESTALYQQVREFARSWTTQYGTKLPILTGAGPGIMEAGSRGAMEAGGPSIGYTTYYGPATDHGDPKLAFRRYVSMETKQTNDIITDGLIFSSVAVRESMMILHSAAMIIAPGGTGTEWEIFQILETIKSRQLARVPIFLVGDREVHWASFFRRLEDMAARGTVTLKDLPDLVPVTSARELQKQLEISLHLRD